MDEITNGLSSSRDRENDTDVEEKHSQAWRECNESYSMTPRPPFGQPPMKTYRRQRHCLTVLRGEGGRGDQIMDGTSDECDGWQP